MNEIETEKYLLILEAVIDECPDDTSTSLMEYCVNKKLDDINKKNE